MRCVGKLEYPPTIAGRYKKATILLRFDERSSVTQFRENFEKWKEAHEMYKIDHK